MNIEFLLLIADYFRTITKRDVLLEWFCPAALGVAFYYTNKSNQKIDELTISTASSAINLLGVLIGFSIAVITLLLSSTSSNIEEIKQKETEYRISNKKITLFDLLLINYSYSVVFEVLLVIANLFLPSLLNVVDCQNSINWINSINVTLICHILLLTVRNITNFYFIHIKKSS